MRAITQTLIYIEVGYVFALIHNFSLLQAAASDFYFSLEIVVNECCSCSYNSY